MFSRVSAAFVLYRIVLLDRVMLSRHTTPFAHSSPPAGSLIVVICAVSFDKLRLDLSQAVGWASPSNGLVAPLLAFPKWKSNAFV